MSIPQGHLYSERWNGMTTSTFGGLLQWILPWYALAQQMDKFLSAHCGKETDGGSTSGKQSRMHSMTVVLGLCSSFSPE